MATYNANISVKVAGLSQLKNLENRVQQLQDRFTKLNGAAARITAPFQGHIKALTEINRLLRENNTLLNQQSRIASAVSRASGGGGGGGSKTDAKVQAEVTEQLNRQIRLLRDRARQIDASGQAMQKLLKAEVEINAQVGGNVRLGRQLIKNARELINAEEQRGRAAEAAAARELKAKQEIWQLQAKALQEQERAEARVIDARVRNAARAARDAERSSGSTGRGGGVGGALRVAGRVGGAVDRAFGGTFSGVGRALEGGAIRGLAVGGALAGVRGLGGMLSNATQQVQWLESHGMGALKGIVPGANMAETAMGRLIEQMAQMPEMLGAAAVAAAVFAPMLPKMAKGAYQLGEALGSLDASQPLKKLLNKTGASFTESVVNPLSAMSMKLPAGPGAQGPGASSAAAFGSNMGLQMVKTAADQMLVAIQAAADKQEQARQTAQGWANALRQGQEWIRESTARIREFEGAQSEAARKRLAASTRTVGSSMTVVAQEAGRQQYAYNRELFPGGNTMAAQPQYRQQLNDAAITAESKTLEIRYNWAKALRQGLEIQKDITEAVKAEAAEEAKVLQITQKKAAYDEMKARRENRTRERRSRVERLRTDTGTVSARERGAMRQQRTESIALGVGFPLMFGAGVGSIAGSLAGSFMGSGFGGQIAGGAIGQIFDQFAAGATEMGKALRNPIASFDDLREKGLFASQAQEQLIANLIELGRVSEAAALIQGEMAKKIGGSGVNDLIRLGAASDEAAKAWAELNLQMQAAVAGPLASLLTWVTAILKLQNDASRAGNQVGDILKGLNPQQQAAFQKEMLQNNQRYGTSSKAFEEEAKIMARYRQMAGPTEIKGQRLSPEEQQKAADAQLNAAERAETLRRQGIQLERSTQDLRLQIEDQAYGFRQRAADLERANLDLRRSVEDEIFKKRQDITRIEADNARQQAQLAIERLDMQLAGGRVSGNVPGQDIANQLLDAVRQYVKTRSEAEADLQLKERLHTIEMEDLKKASEKFRFDVARKVDELNRQGAELTRDVERAKITTARAVYDLQVQAADYQLAKMKESIALMTDAAQRLAATGGLTGQIAGPYGALSGLIGGVESYGGNYGAFNRGGSNNGHTPHGSGIDPNLVNMTIAEIQRRQLAPNVPRNQQLHAVGKYQIIGGTLRGLLNGSYGPTGVTAQDKFTPEVQEKLFAALARNRLVPGSVNKSMAGLRQEWIGLQNVPDAQLAPIVKQLLAGGSATPAAPSAAAPPALPASVGQATSQLGGVKLPGASDVSGLMASLAQLDQKLLSAKTNALELAKAFSQLTKEQAAQMLGQSVTAIVDQLNAPMDQLLKSQKDAAAFQREYAGLITEGMTPALAEQVSKIREQVRLQLEQLDTAVAQLEATKTKLMAEGKWTEELQKQLDLLKAQKGVIEGKGQDAEGSARAENSPGQRLQDAYTKVRGELNDLTDPVNQVVAGANAIGSAFGQAFQDMASGSKTAQQALADMFKSIANHFLDMASQMIAKYIEMQIIGLAQGLIGGALGGAAGGGGAAWGGSGGAAWGGFAGALQMPSLMASGGFVTGPTPAIVGEGGANEYVIPENKMGSAMARWSAGARGDSVVNGADPTGGVGTAVATAPPQVNITGGILNFNDSHYIRADQVPSIISQASKAGEQRALSTLKNSPGARRRVRI